MTYTYYEGIRAKHTMNINFTKIRTNITQTIYIPLENGEEVQITNVKIPEPPNWEIRFFITLRRPSCTWSQFVVSGCYKSWLICHSVASSAICMAMLLVSAIVIIPDCNMYGI